MLIVIMETFMILQGKNDCVEKLPRFIPLILNLVHRPTQ